MLNLRNKLSHPTSPSIPSQGLPQEETLETHPMRCEHIFITRMHATELACGLRRLPAGFYVRVEFNGTSAATSNKTVSIDRDIAEWNDEILLPSMRSTVISFQVYASFEQGLRFGRGELLRRLKISVQEILDRNERLQPIKFLDSEDELVSSCLSLRIAAEIRNCEGNGCDTGVKLPTPVVKSEAEELTDEGHHALLCYRRGQHDQDQTHLDKAIQCFEQVRDNCPIDDPNRSAALFNLANAKFIHCQAYNNYLDLDVPIGLYRDALRLRAPGHPDHIATILELGLALLARFKHRGNEVDKIDATDLLGRVVELAPAGSHTHQAGRLGLQMTNVCVSLHPRESETPDGVDTTHVIQRIRAMLHTSSRWDPLYPGLLAQLGMLLRGRFEEHGDLMDINLAVSVLDEAVLLVPNGHTDKPGYLNNLGVSLLDRFERLGDVADVTQSVSIQEEAVRLTPDGHPDKPGLLNNLSCSLLSRFECLGDIMDITKSVLIQEEIVRLTPDSHPGKARWLSNLGTSLSRRFERLGDVADLTKSVLIFQEAVRLTPDGHPDKPGLLNNLGNSLSSRFERLGDVTDLTKSVSMFEEAVRLTPDGHPDKPGRLNNWGNPLFRRFQRLGDVADIMKSVSIQEQAVHLIPDGHPLKPILLHNLGNSLSCRFERLGDVADIARLVLTQEEAVRLTPDGHPDKPRRLNSLGSSLLRRFERFGDIADIAKSVLIQEEAVHLTPDGHPDKPRRLNNLGSSLFRRFKRLGDVADIMKSVWILEEAVRLTPDGHPDKSTLLHNLGHSLSRRFDRLGDVADITKSVSMFEEAVRLVPDGHPVKPCWLKNLGSSLLSRFERLGDIADITKSVSMKEEAVRFTPDGHPDKSGQLDSLGSSLLSRFERLGDVADLTKSVSIREEAVRLTLDGHPDKPGRLSNLGSSLFYRFGRLGDVADITKSVSIREEAVNLTPDGHPDKPTLLSSLGISLLSRFERLGDVVDITKSVSIQEEAVRLTPDGHPDKPGRLDNLGNSLCLRFERLHDVGDITKSVSIREEAIRLTPDGHPDKPGRLNNLGSSLLSRFARLRDIASITQLVSMFEEAVHLTPDGHANKPGLLHNLGISFILRFSHSRDPSHLSIAISHFSVAAQCSMGSISVRFNAACLWIRFAQTEGNSETLLHAYTTALHLLPQLAWIGLSLKERHRVLVDAASIVREAAAAALDAGYPDIAVEWLEQGRSIVWNQFLELRAPVDLLRVAHPSLADEFEQASKQLESASSRNQITSDDMANKLGSNFRSLEDEVQKHHALALRREKLLTHIRSLPDFDRFMLPKTADQLASLATSGPAVYLNASAKRCDALIVMADLGSVILVPLSAVTYHHVERMHHLLLDHKCPTISNDDLSLLALTGERSAIDRAGRLANAKAHDRFHLVLGFLWRNVVNPILGALGISSSPSQVEKMPRIFWCPTGPFAFLPIHAAGIYGSSPTGPKLSDFAISSYIPTLSVFTPSTRTDAPIHPSNIRLLTVPQPLFDGESPLLGVKGEIDTIKALSNGSQFVTTEDSNGKFEDVTGKMAGADWVHFACHGVQDPVHPLDSGLCLADRRRLKLSDIIRLSRQQGGLAFLSACETAKGDEKLSEESVHLAAGMLLAGYGGVIATMWPIMDNDAPKVARDVYKHLFREGKVPDTTEAAEALHRAVVRLRDEDNVPFSSWVPFIHFGR